MSDSRRCNGTGEPVLVTADCVVCEELDGLATYHGLDATRIGRLAHFSRSTPELFVEFGRRSFDKVQRWGSEHPAHRLFGHLGEERFERLGERLLGGRYDIEFLHYLEDRVGGYDIQGAEPRWMWFWAPELPSLVVEIATQQGYTRADVAELADTTHRVCLFLTTLMNDVYISARNRRLVDAEADRRFRVMVESARDVITIVSTDERVEIMTPDAPLLEHLGLAAHATTVRELIPADAIEPWRRADARLGLGASAETTIFEVTEGDDGRVVVEGHGRPMGNEDGARVWIWRDVTSRVELELELNRRAFHDELTGVANRSLLVDRLELALRRRELDGRPVALLFCDVDNFKWVNDAVGHTAGDALLVEVARRLESCLRATDTVARLGGDEFAVLLEGASDEDAERVARRMVAAVAAETDVSGQPFFPSISIGVASAADGVTASDVLRRADLAMYAAKRAGRARVEHYLGELGSTALEKVELATDLRSAVHNGELELHHQPLIHLETGEVEGVEALLRWNHPERGWVPPAEFVPIAEATGLILEVGAWVVDRACADIRAIEARTGRALGVHVNVSPVQLRHPDFTRSVSDALCRSGLPADRLVIEVTEGALLDDDHAIGRLDDLRAIGLQVAIDDFGTGYTSINYLRQLPVDIIKIDRSLVSRTTDPDGCDDTIMAALIQLSRALGLHSVAEGIEHQVELDCLRNLGCDSGQGWYWARAMPLDELVAHLREMTSDTTATAPVSGAGT